MNFFWEKKQGRKPKRIPKNQPSLKIRETRLLSFHPFCKGFQNQSWDGDSLQKFRVFPASQKSQVRRSPASCDLTARPLWKAHMGTFVQRSWEIQHHCHLHQLPLLANVFPSSLTSSCWELWVHALFSPGRKGARESIPTPLCLPACTATTALTGYSCWGISSDQVTFRGNCLVD